MTAETEYIEQGRTFHGHVPLIMGTGFDLIVSGLSEGEAWPIWASLLERLEGLDKMLDRFSPTSEVSLLNQSASLRNVSVSEELYEIIQKALEYNKLTLGLFDITLGHAGEISVEDGKVSLCGNHLDFGGFAKGYFLSVAKRILEDGGAKSYFADFGGSSIMAAGSHPFGSGWKVSVTNPFTGSLLAEYSLVNSSLSTSGNTAKYTGHIVNPVDGKRNTEKKLSVVRTADPLDAEVLSTSLMIASSEQKELILNNFPTAETKTYDL